MKIDVKSIYILVVFLSIMGFPIVAILSQIFSLNSTSLSIFIRFVVFSLSFLLIGFTLKYIKLIRRYEIFLILMLFWILYICRLIDLTFFTRADLINSYWYYWIWAIGTCFFPFIAISLFQVRDFSIYKKIFNYLFISLFVAVPLVIIFGSTEIPSDILEESVDTGRFRLNSLNPISVGSLGALLALLAYWLYFDLKLKIYKNIFLMLSFFLGLYLMILANSRGPIVGFFVVLIFITLKYIDIRILLKSMFVLISLFIVFYFVNLDELLVGNRFFDSNSVETALEDSRVYIYKNSLNIFFDNPLLGSNIIDPISRLYPHNLFIESLISTGLIGGIFYSTGVLILLYASMRKVPNDILGISILFLYNFVISLLSGAIYNSTSFWISCGIILSFYYRLKR
ncbi:O-antigen ligase family protein [Acinetobacter variabilis]|uniref:O-antigen ligase family protein n=1 Tax=Acinetobacter variabilis TaxID=70346 RepID=UPI002672C4EE|nr:O-antigen ligase family protein [Acinetobacter variabilis]WKT73381.1 O-antigen ligase family protein [Acinetobacter variabilis]